MGGKYRRHGYAGEIKKSIFTILNYLLPERDVLPMHCSANIGPSRRCRRLLRPFRHRQDDAVGRPASRTLIGDDEHGWGERRLQLRGRLLRQGDPPRPRGRAGDLRHHRALRHILENVVLDPVTRRSTSTTRR
jgi:phosphoenolpyruvate carboxykinase (ATP)